MVCSPRNTEPEIRSKKGRKGGILAKFDRARKIESGGRAPENCRHTASIYINTSNLAPL